MNSIASHNSMTYLPPKHWWLYPFRFIARCQSKTIQEQYEKYGIRCFDLRITFDKNNRLCFAHGLMKYKRSVLDILYYLNTLRDDIKVRLILEDTKPDANNAQLFESCCEHFEKGFKNITFFEGRRKCDWKLLYDFKYKPSYEQKISSMTWKKWDDWFPWLYAKHMNNKNIKAGTDKDFLFIDFVNIS